MKTLFCTLIFVLFGVFTTQAQDKTAITYTYKGKLYTQQEFIDSVCIKFEKKDTEYIAMTDFLKAKNETDVLNKIKFRFRIYELKEAGLDPTTVAKEVEESTKRAEASKKFLASLDTTVILEPSNEQKTTKLTQLSKDVNNKVVGSEKKYVDYVDKYPDLKKDEKVKLMYEKCKAKLGKK